MPETPLDWNQQDAINLRTYIAANPKFIANLMRRLPKIKGDTMEARAVTGSDVNGYLKAVEEIERMELDPNKGGGDKPGYLPNA